MAKRTSIDVQCSPARYHVLRDLAKGIEGYFSDGFVPHHSFDWENKRPFPGKAHFTFETKSAAMLFKLYL